MPVRSIGRAIALFVMAAALSTEPVSAQSQVTIVIPIAAGGTADVSMRTIAAKVEELGGPKIVIENRPGGGGITASLGVKNAPPDGRTLLLAFYATFVVNPAMADSFPFDPINDFHPITTLFSFPLMLTVPSSLEAKSVADLVALAKRKPDGLSNATQGVGTAGHLLGELFAKASGAPLLHVPYKGAAQGIIDLVAARVDMMFLGSGLTKGHRENETLRALAATSKTRLSAAPELPTTAELGYPDVNTDFVWFGLVAPPNTPPALVQNLNQMFVKALEANEVQAKFGAQGVALGGSTPAQFLERIKGDTVRFGPLIKAAAAAK